MNVINGQAAVIAPVARPKRRRRGRFAMLMTALTAQYTIIAVVTAVTLAATLRCLVTPKIVATYEAIMFALNYPR